MGHAAQILLVIISTLLVYATPARADRVNAAHYQDFWLWAAVKPQPVLHQARTLYLHQGEIARRQGKIVFLRQGLPASKLRVDSLWLSYRVTMLALSDRHLNLMLKMQAQWRKQGNRVNGIQIDFDARSYQLAGYVDFLQDLRQRLPADTRLSVTGLLDWAKTGDVAQLNRLSETIDELVVQTYQGRYTVSRYAEYLPALLKLTLPFRIGLVQHGQWESRWQHWLTSSPWYRGEVVFLVNPPPVRASGAK